MLRSCHKNGLQVCVCVGFWALEVCITQIIVFHFHSTCWVVSLLFCFGEDCFLDLLGDSLREILKCLNGGNGAVMYEGYEDCVNHLKCQCYGGLYCLCFQTAWYCIPEDSVITFHTYRIFSNLIRTSFCRFLKRKKC